MGGGGCTTNTARRPALGRSGIKPRWVCATSSRPARRAVRRDCPCRQRAGGGGPAPFAGGAGAGLILLGRAWVLARLSDGFLASGGSIFLKRQVRRPRTRKREA